MYVHGPLHLFHPAAKAGQTAALANGCFRDHSIVGDRQDCRGLRQAAVCKDPRAARVTDAVGRAFADDERKQLPRGSAFREMARQLDCRAKFLCPRLCVGQRVDGRIRHVGVQKSDGRAPLFGKCMQLLHILALPVGTAHREQ